MQGLTREFDRHDNAILFGRVIERVIRAVADQRQAFVRRLRANLMRATRLQIEFQFRNDAARAADGELLDHFVMRHRLLRIVTGFLGRAFGQHMLAEICRRQTAANAATCRAAFSDAHPRKPRTGVTRDAFEIAR